MPYNLLPAPGEDFTGNYIRYQIDLPDNEDYRALLTGALSFSGDAESYQIRGNEPPNLHDILTVAAYSISTLKVLMTDPVGTLKFASFKDNNDAPDNWLLCDGQIVSSGDYPGLAQSALVTNAGGAANIQLPDFRGKTIRGTPASGNPGDIVGLDSVQLTASQNGPHTHVIDDFSATTILNGENVPRTVSTPGSFPFNTNSSGNGAPHENRSRMMYTDVWIVAKL